MSVGLSLKVGLGGPHYIDKGGAKTAHLCKTDNWDTMGRETWATDSTDQSDSTNCKSSSFRIQVHRA